MFQLLEETTVHLRKFSKREEIHGKEMVPAIDLALSQKGPNTLLDNLHPELRRALFRAGKNTSGQLDMPIDDMPHIRVPSLGMPLDVAYEQTGCSLRVAYGSGGKSDVVLGLVKLHKMKIAGIAEGGAVELQYTLSCSNEINEKIIGRLGILGGHDISITLEAPTVEEPPIKAAPVDPKNDPAWPFPGDAPAESVNDSTEAPPTTPEEAFAGTAAPQQ